MYDFDERLERESIENFDMYFLASILNFQRQFRALFDVNENENFGRSLLGHTPALQDSVAQVDETQSTDKNILVPVLNPSQDKAAIGFLSSTQDTISIVQG